jgi:3-methyladenine DNA glycosylase AlkD
MTLDETLSALKAAGSEQTRKTFARHCVNREMFGVKYSDLEKVRKKIKIDHALAEQLWKTGNHDAIILAAMIADPAKASLRFLNAWIKDVDNSLIADALAKFVGKTSFAVECFEEWRKSKNDSISSTGWMVLRSLVSDNKTPDGYFEKLLPEIEKGIHSAKNETKATMNGALIAIGGRNANLEKPALAAAARIGKVEVDHGDTACETPDATAYIKKIAARRKK